MLRSAPAELPSDVCDTILYPRDDADDHDGRKRVWIPPDDDSSRNAADTC